MSIYNFGPQNNGHPEESMVPGMARRRVTFEDVTSQLEQAIDKIRKRAAELEDEDVTYHLTLSTERDES